MLADKEVGHVSRLIPFRLALHVVRDEPPVDGEVLESHVSHHVAVVVTSYDAYVGLLPGVADVAKRDVLYAAPRPVAVFAVEAHTEVHYHAAVDVLYVEIVEKDVTDKDVVAVVDGYAALIVHLLLALLKDVNVFVHHVAYLLVLRCLAVQPYHDGMRYIGPVDIVADSDVMARAVVLLSGAIYSGAVVACAREEMALPHVARREDVEAVAPSVPTHHLGVAHLHGVVAANRQLRGQRSVDKHPLRVSHHNALMAAWHHDACAENAYIVSLPYGEPALDHGSAVYKHSLARRH